MSLIHSLKANKAINTLLESDNPNDPAVISAITKIKEIGHNAVPRLIDALLDSPGNKTIEGLLVALLDNKSLPEFIDGLADTNRTLVSSIARIMATGNNYDPNQLLPYLDDPEIPKNVLLQILIARKSRLNLRKVIGLLDKADKSKRTIAFHLIHAVATPDIIPFLVQYIDDPDISTRLQVIRTVAQFNTEQVRHILIKSLTDSSKLMRQAALEGIAAQNIPVPANVICPLLRDPDMTVQSKAIEALTRLKDPATASNLIDILNDDSEYVRRAAVEVLNEVADTRAIKNLLTAMRDTDWWVRVRAADALGSIGGPRVVEAVLGLLQEKDEFLRRTAVEILNSVKDERAYFYLIQALADEDWWVRERAVDALGQLGDKRAIPDLFDAMEKYPESTHIIVQSLVKLGDDSIVQQLMQKANEASGELRKEMLLAISEFAKKEDLDQNTSMQDVKTRIMNAGELRDQSQNLSRPTMINQELSPSQPRPKEENSAGILDLSASNANVEVAQVFDATKFSPGYIIANRYRVVKQIGKGAFGVVVLVEDMMVNEEIILKFLNAHMSSDENIIQRFIHELRYARKITHENIIRIYDFITFGRSYAISMEYFKSHSMAFEIKMNKNPNIRRMLTIFLDICKGVGYAHSRDVIHRDLKPANILINDQDEVKIVDFGLAAAASSADSRITRTGILVGTPTYMAPEQVRARAIDQRTDIYSLGILLYEVFVGRAPYKGEDHLATLFQHVEGKAVPAHQANPKISEALSAVIMKTMAVSPEARYQTAEELMKAIETLVEQEAA
ncbi:MAG: protein kinase [Gammaproteobacteria bacterium]|nr:protein kinase [Gammaproteobacteria bacterium]